jgi:putative membrane protein
MIRRLLRRLLTGDDDEGTFDDALIRTYLANERTFLAWLRTAVVLLGVGVGAIALGSAGDLSKEPAFALGGFSVFAALVMVVWAYLSFGSTTLGIEERRYRPPRALVATASFMVIVAATVVLTLLAAEVLE